MRQDAERKPTTEGSSGDVQRQEMQGYVVRPSPRARNQLIAWRRRTFRRHPHPSRCARRPLPPAGEV